MVLILSSYIKGFGEGSESVIAMNHVAMFHFLAKIYIVIIIIMSLGERCQSHNVFLIKCSIILGEPYIS